MHKIYKRTRAECCSGTGEELYLIPGIDMINHSSRPQERNTALEQSSDGVIFRQKPDLPPEEYNGGLFVMKAGGTRVHNDLANNLPVHFSLNGLYGNIRST